MTEFYLVTTPFGARRHPTMAEVMFQSKNEVISFIVLDNDFHITNLEIGSVQTQTSPKFYCQTSDSLVQ
jgi:hypothetical protein